MTSTPHTLKAFDEEQNALRALIRRMGEHAQRALDDALRCLLEHDAEGAARIVARDHQLDDMEAQAETHVVQIIARRAPMADDLRDLIAAHKIAGTVERIGDYAKNIAKRVPMLEPVGEAASPSPLPVSLLPEMGRVAGAQVHDALEAFITRDATLAAQVCASDRVVDDYYTAMLRSLLTCMMEAPQNIAPATHLLFVARNIERIGDHATNLAEMVYFAATGQRLGERVRGEDGVRL
ncbi:phosphate signaling complex protein PhoU [Novosphingobium sp. 1949]|uniref:Phosphate-specific transport system accessory protein PhoU n=1 Tax=Novosphingobium organovorum TaxID=2930092 RepID=A0ABT0BG00_9SPHN|nr:phosphate signaling complex protein PhoU [Novosphingobium organovorum]MCJ2183982.1 phosphate signaling complex protein PhoU [Novosphingobium organovorum]